MFSIDGTIPLYCGLMCFSDAVSRHVECLELVVFTILAILCILLILYFFVIIFFFFFLWRCI